MHLTQHGTKIKLCYRVTRDRSGEPGDNLGIAVVLHYTDKLCYRDALRHAPLHSM